MGVLWQQREQSGEWEFSFIRAAERAAASAEDRHPPFRLVPFQMGVESRMALVARLGEQVFVNGERVLGGLKVLEHRDEIMARGRRYYYSAHSLPVVSRFELAPGGRRPKCPVCRDVIDEGASVVVCPQCGKVYHQAAGGAVPADGAQLAPGAEGDQKRCWTHREQCLCHHPTSLDESAAWRPDREGQHG